MRNICSHLNQVRFLVSQAIATLVGCVLLAIGVSGALGTELEPIASISFLVEHTKLGPQFNHYYWVSLAIVGGWLVVFVFVRLAASIAIFMIISKWLIINVEMLVQ